MPKKSYHCVLDEYLHTLVAQGNHEAYQKLKKRYYFHSLKLSHEILNKYPDSGIDVYELTAVCDNCFSSIVKKYDISLSSFFSFWKEASTNAIMDYLIDNAYTSQASGYNRALSIDQDLDERHTFSELLCENDEDLFKKRKIFEAKCLITKNEDAFSKQEAALLNLVLDGYTIGDMEHSGVLSRSALYLTFNNAVEKLKTIIENGRGNKK